jgi:hypothetical protein
VVQHLRAFLNVSGLPCVCACVRVRARDTMCENTFGERGKQRGRSHIGNGSESCAAHGSSLPTSCAPTLAERGKSHAHSWKPVMLAAHLRPLYVDGSSLMRIRHSVLSRPPQHRLWHTGCQLCGKGLTCWSTAMASSYHMYVSESDCGSRGSTKVRLLVLY